MRPVNTTKALASFSLIFLIVMGFASVVASQTNGGPVATASVTANGTVNAVYGIEIVAPGTNTTVETITFGNVVQQGTYYSYVDLRNVPNSSAPLAVGYAVDWEVRPTGFNASLQALNDGVWQDLNSSSIVLKPGESTDSFAHQGFPSAIRAELFVGDAGNVTYSLKFTVYGFLSNPAGPTQVTETPSPSVDTTETPTLTTSKNSGSAGSWFKLPFALPGVWEIAALLAAAIGLSTAAIAIRSRGSRRRNKTRLHGSE